jgi:1,4-dihydroxy-2-naphthoate polyprenyltransferase
VPVGLLASAIMVVNNVRDIDTDRRARKRTLAVRLGRERARVLYATMLALAYLAPIVLVIASDLSAWILLTLLTAPLALPLVRTLFTRTDGPSLNKTLAGTGQLLAAYSVVLSAGLLL